MEFEDSIMNNFHAIEEVNNQARAARGRWKYDQNTKFSSKNLEAERSRRKKLNERLMSLRAMNKATILDDAITYIEVLQDEVKDLSEKLQVIEAIEESDMRSMDDIAVLLTEKCNIEADVQVTALDGNKMWIKINCENKKGVFNTFMEAFGSLGFELIDINLTTSKGLILISFSVEVGDACGWACSSENEGVVDGNY
ncbi:hypothetical protein NE237_006094 [Protea cynaroides]|uniref:BHLH domain-containing protein n=1 Tax=Protea cynaroides TaxID=273540 RepID=A0A9Q0KM09_9MAGN|nr:hypothetical protein NE237_006094 [Protea cynaroides]